MVNGVDLEEVRKFIFAFKMFGVPRLGIFSQRQNSCVKHTESLSLVPSYETLSSLIHNWELNIRVVCVVT